MRGERGDTVVDVASDVVSLPDAPPPEEVVDHIPHGVDWRYEPDWDGLRVTARLGPGVARLVSGRRRNYDPFFPEVVGSLSEFDIRDTIVEGSLIVTDANGLTFASVRRRLHPSSTRVEWLARSSPATLALTDVVMDRGDVIAHRPLAERRRSLEAIASEIGAPTAPANLRRIVPGQPFVLTPQTLDLTVARGWLNDRDLTGRDGVIARHADGETFVRVRRVRTVACVATGYRTSGSGGLGSVRLGMYDGDRLVEVGRTTAFRRAPARRAAAAALATVAPGGGVVEEGPDWVDVLPALVCEVRFDRLRGSRFRRAATFVRWLPDREPSTCTIDQLTS
jgi:ATP-dependent DNA ligase